MPKFRTIYTERVQFKTDCSNKIEDVYELNGHTPIKVGTRNVYEEIQAEAESADIQNILRKYATGELIQGKADTESPIQDYTQVPTDLVSTSMVAQQAQSSWNSLPTNVKALFNNDIKEFAKASPTELTAKLASLFTKEEVKTEEKKEETK